MVMRHGTPAADCCMQPKKRQRMPRVEKVPVKPPPEAAAARAGPALKVWLGRLRGGYMLSYAICTHRSLRDQSYVGEAGRDVGSNMR